MRFNFSLFCVLLLIGSLVPVSQAKDAITIRVAHLNDVYQIGQGTPNGGVSRFSAFLKSVMALPNSTLVTFGGDTLSPSVASSEFKGKQMIAAWNALKVDVAVLGNHEFDFGPAVLEERIRESRFPWLAANVFKRGTGELFPATRASVIKEIEGVRVALVGVITEDTARISRVGPDYEFRNAINSLCAEADRVRKDESVQVVVGLTHLDLEADRRAARKCSVDVILGGHDHHIVSEIVSGKPIFKAGADAKDAVVVNLIVDRDSKKLDRLEWQLVPLDKLFPEDPEILALAKNYEEVLQDRLAAVIGETASALDARTATVRMRDSKAGYLVADAFREAMGADVALVNGGALRSDVVIPAGPISKLDIKKLLPFENHVLKLELTGKQLVTVLENLSEKLGTVPLGRFPHVSGMKVVFDRSKPHGKRVAHVAIGSKPIEMDRHYALAVSEYLAAGNDSYDPLKGARHLVPEDLAPIETEVVIDYIAKRNASLHYVDEQRVIFK